MKIKVKDQDIYLFLLSVYFVLKYCEYTTITAIGNILVYIEAGKNILYVCFLALWVTRKLRMSISKKYLIFALFIILYFAYQGFIKGRADVFGAILCGINLNEDWFDRVIERLYKLSIVLFITTILLSLVGVIENIEIVSNKWNGIVNRASFGFEYPGQFSMMLIPIVFMFYYLHRDDFKLRHSVVWILIDLIVFTMSRTYMATVLIILAIIIFHMKFRVKRKIIICFPTVCVFIDMILLFLKSKSNPIVEVIDIIINFRLNLGVTFAEMYGVTLFGTNYVNSTDYEYYQILDSEYTYDLVACGVIYLVIVTVLLTIIMKHCYEKKKNQLLIIWMLLSINSIVNNGLFNLIMNPFVLILFSAIKSVLTSSQLYGKNEGIR